MGQRRATLLQLRWMIYTRGMQTIPTQAVAAAATVGEALEAVAAALEASPAYYGHGTDNAWDEAVQLVLWCAQLPADSDDRVLPLPLASAQASAAADLLHRRVTERVPLPYLTGEAWFAGLRWHCDPRAIIPRSPIAELLRAGYQPWYRGPGPARLLDLCCGGGCIGLASAWYMPDAQVDLLDLDADALALATVNARALGLEQRVRILQSDLFHAVAGERYDIIVTNPPYVDATDLSEMPAEYAHEPALALGSGEDGLDVTRQILMQAKAHLQPHGLLVLEVGNSWEALEAAFPQLPVTWIEFEHGGHGVCVLSAAELPESRPSAA